jgi:amino acid transporter
MSEQKGLKKSLSATMLALYGAGTILGAGIFVLIGKVAGTAGYWTPLAFMLAALVAGLNGMVYAELSTRRPGAGGPTSYTREAFSTNWFSTIIGWMIVATGVVSAATITAGFSGYLLHFVEMPEWIAKTAVLGGLGLVAILGAKESAWFMAVTTTMGIIGLFIVIYAGFIHGDRSFSADFTDNLPSLWESGITWGVLSATFLAVYSFIGFEDMVHMAEEVKKPAKAMPIAIAVAIGVAAVFYVVTSVASLMVMEPDALKNSEAPLVDVVKKAGLPEWPLAVLSLAIILNGALTQIIMGSRVIYSLGNNNGAPSWMAKVNGKTDTPVIATAIATAIALTLVLFFPLTTLASITSFIMLLVFIASSAALIKLEREKPEAPFDTPNWLPWVALVLTVALLITSFFVSGGGH